jgi:hypothetical protein
MGKIGKEDARASNVRITNVDEESCCFEKGISKISGLANTQKKARNLKLGKDEVDIC